MLSLKVFACRLILMNGLLFGPSSNKIGENCDRAANFVDDFEKVVVRPKTLMLKFRFWWLERKLAVDQD